MPVSVRSARTGTAASDCRHCQTAWFADDRSGPRFSPRPTIPPHKLEKHDRLGRLDFEGDLGSEDVEMTDIPLRMLGRHQADNAALAIATVAQLRKQGWRISSDAICETFSNLTLPGRIELVRRRPAVVLDVAHNVAAAEALVEVLETSFWCTERIAGARRDPRQRCPRHRAGVGPVL